MMILVNTRIHWTKKPVNCVFTEIFREYVYFLISHIYCNIHISSRSKYSACTLCILRNTPSETLNGSDFTYYQKVVIYNFSTFIICYSFQPIYRETLSGKLKARIYSLGQHGDRRNRLCCGKFRLNLGLHICFVN